MRLTTRDGREVHDLRSRQKPLAVLAYLLAAEPPGFRERDELLALFWPGFDEHRARRALRKTLFVLRRTVGSEAIVSGGRNQVAVEHRLLWCDVPVFREALGRGERHEALALYRGELLPAFHVRGLRDFEAWLDATRRKLKALASRASWALAEEAPTEGEAVEWARKAMTCASAYDEGAIRSFVEILDAHGRRAEALQAYEAFAQRLEEDLGIAPSPETRALVAAVRAR